jgi:hypothetical protein
VHGWPSTIFGMKMVFLTPRQQEVQSFALTGKIAPWVYIPPSFMEPYIRKALKSNLFHLCNPQIAGIVG